MSQLEHDVRALTALLIAEPKGPKEREAMRQCAERTVRHMSDAERDRLQGSPASATRRAQIARQRAAAAPGGAS